MSAATTQAAPASKPGETRVGSLIAAACLVHVLVWSLAPPFYVGNLHTDTVEATSWATRWDWGYFKHPPLVTWLFRLLDQAPGERLRNDLLLSQAGVALSAFFIWRGARLYISSRAAAAAALIYLASPPATFFAMQVNHNSLSIPFGAAILCFGLRYLEQRRTFDIVALAIAGGLGLLTKYQIAFFLMALAVFAVAVPRFRWVWRDARSYLGGLASFLIFAPHLWWDYQHGWRTLLYASADRPMRTIGDFGYGLNELLDGLLMCAVSPLLAWLILGCPRPFRRGGDLTRLGALVAATPIVIMVALGFSSGQILRQGWLIPLMPAVAIGLALIAAPTIDAAAPNMRGVIGRLMAVSIGQVVAFAVFLYVRAASGGPVAAYMLDGRLLAERIDAIWRRDHAGPIPCLLMQNRSLGLSTMLHLRPLPRVFDLDESQIEGGDPFPACKATGGIVLSPEGQAITAQVEFLGLSGEAIDVPTRPLVGTFRWTFRAFVIPPPK